MTRKLNIDKAYSDTSDRRPAGNSRLASCGVKCLNSSAVFQSNFSAGLPVKCSEIPHERQAAKRYKQPISRKHDGQKLPSTKKKANTGKPTFWHFCILPTARGNRTKYKRAKIHQPHASPKAC